MGDALPLVDLGTVVEAADVVVGNGHSCALLSDARVKCWGDNSIGQLGLGDAEHRGDEPGEMGDALPFVDLGADAVELGAGSLHTCALLTTGQVKCWGGNDHGQLGLGHTTDRDRPVAVDLGSGVQVASLVVGGLNACALLVDSTAKCWGVNNYGQLGIGEYLSRGDEAGDMGDNLPPVDLGTNAEVVRMAPARSHFTCALLTGDRVKCWGMNRYGELGLGTTHDRGLGKEPDHMGDNLPFVDLGFDID